MQKFCIKKLFLTADHMRECLKWNQIKFRVIMLSSCCIFYWKASYSKQRYFTKEVSAVGALTAQFVPTDALT